MDMKIIIYSIILSLLFVTCSNPKEKLPSINIVKETSIGWNDKEPCTIEYSDIKSKIKTPAKIKCRGGMSSKYFKHSFSLELQNEQSFANLPIDDDWIVNANYIDKTFMRHKISYDLFRQMSPKNIASKCAYINLNINNKYEGLYVLMEEINGSMIGLDKKDSLSMLFKDPPIFYKEKLSFVQDSTNYYQQKYPKINKDDKTHYIEKFKNFIFNANDQDFAKDITNWVDIDNVIDWHIILLFSNNGDGIMKNFFLYKLDSKTPFRFAIWDYDHSFGRDGDNELNMGEKELEWESSILLKRLVQLKETEYTSKLKSRWEELRKLNIISHENFNTQIKLNNKIINSNLENNSKKWPLDFKWYYDSNNYQQEIDLMSLFVKQRITQLDKYITNL